MNIISVAPTFAHIHCRISGIKSYKICCMYRAVFLKNYFLNYLKCKKWIRFNMIIQWELHPIYDRRQSFCKTSSFFIFTMIPKNYAKNCEAFSGSSYVAFLVRFKTINLQFESILYRRFPFCWIFLIWIQNFTQRFYHATRNYLENGSQK